MAVECCDECGFNGAEWTDTEAIDAAASLPGRWSLAIDDLTTDQMQQRAFDDMWSIAEYTNHVRETAFGMRFVLDTILTAPATNLGDPPESPFEHQPRDIDTTRALSGFDAEVTQLCEGLRALPADQWEGTCTIGGDDVDVHWIARHIVHDVTHHLGDVALLRRALNRPRSTG